MKCFCYDTLIAVRSLNSSSTFDYRFVMMLVKRISRNFGICLRSPYVCAYNWSTTRFAKKLEILFQVSKLAINVNLISLDFQLRSKKMETVQPLALILLFPFSFPDWLLMFNQNCTLTGGG